MAMDSLTVGAALAGILARLFEEPAGAAGRQPPDAATGRLWRRLRARLDPASDAAGAIAELRANPRNRAAGLVLGDEISRVLDADPELFGLAVALVERSARPVAAAA
jgi:hypothetical protein